MNRTKIMVAVFALMLLSLTMVSAKELQCSHEYSKVSEVNACEKCQDKYEYETGDEKLLDSCVEKILEEGRHHPGRSSNSKVVLNPGVAIIKCKDGVLTYYTKDRVVYVNLPYLESVQDLSEIQNKYCN